MRSDSIARVPTRRRRLGVAALLVLLPLAACSHQPPAAKLARDAEPIGSWLGTLEMTAQAWGGNRVPAHFAHDTIDAAKEEIESVARSAAESQAAPAVRQPLRRLLAEAHIACRALDAAVTRGDRAAMVPLAARFAALQGRFAAWKRTAGAAT